LRRASTVPEQDRPAKVLALMTKYREQVTEVLTDDQKKTWGQLLGETFDLSRF
jgi:hypothetical protein